MFQYMVTGVISQQKTACLQIKPIASVLMGRKYMLEPMMDWQFTKRVNGVLILPKMAWLIMVLSR